MNIPQIKLVPIDSLVEYHRNSRTHSPAQVAQLEALFEEFGWTNALLVDDMGTVAGHGRTMAAENLYKRGKQIKFPNGTLIPLGYVPVMDCTGWSADQRRAYIIADNQSALQAGWDMELLVLELKELDASGFDLSLTAFDEDALAEMLGDVGPLDELPELPEGDKTPFEQMTFTLHESQADVVRQALAKAMAMGAFVSANENSNGNALARVCEFFLVQNSGGAKEDLF